MLRSKDRRDAVQWIIDRSFSVYLLPRIYCPPSTKMGVGQVVMNAPEEVRNSLRELKSEDLQLREDFVRLFL